MSKLKTMISLLKTPGRIVLPLASIGLFNWLPDRAYLQFAYRAQMGKRLNLDNPVTFNEKLQWLKLYDRNPNYPKMVDKLTAKDYVASIFGNDYTVPTLDVWENADEVDISKLPEKFVLKCTHDSGSIIVCRDKSKFNITEAKEKLQNHLRRSTYWFGREWPYKNLKPRIIAEKYLQNKTDGITKEENGERQQELTDYKFYCFNGYVDCVMICYDRESGDTKFYFFDRDWKLKRINKRGVQAPEGFTLPRPSCLTEMFDIAAKLSVGIPFARIDLYQSDNQIYFGEITFFPESGFDPNYLPETDEYFGNLIDLSLSYGQKKEH